MFGGIGCLSSNTPFDSGEIRITIRFWDFFIGGGSYMAKNVFNLKAAHFGINYHHHWKSPLLLLYFKKIFKIIWVHWSTHFDDVIPMRWIRVLAKGLCPARWAIALLETRLCVCTLCLYCNCFCYWRNKSSSSSICRPLWVSRQMSPLMS